MKYSIVVGTDVGRRKSVNQDSYLVKTASNSSGSVCMALICDGMGGLDEGEKASQTIVNLFNNHFDILVRSLTDEALIDSHVHSLIKRANNLLVDYGNKSGIRLGSTASILLIINNMFHIYHVGDSRIYRVNNKLMQLTQDHTLTASKVRNGRMTEAEAKKSSDRSVLLQCVGVDEHLEVYTVNGKLSNNDVFLLCSDGLYNCLDDKEIESALEGINTDNSEGNQNIIDGIIQTVKNRGETDNITGVIIKVYK